VGKKSDSQPSACRRRGRQDIMDWPKRASIFTFYIFFIYKYQIYKYQKTDNLNIKYEKTSRLEWSSAGCFHRGGLIQTSCEWSVYACPMYSMGVFAMTSHWRADQKTFWQEAEQRQWRSCATYNVHPLCDNALLLSIPHSQSSTKVKDGFEQTLFS